MHQKYSTKQYFKDSSITENRSRNLNFQENNVYMTMGILNVLLLK